MAVFSFWSLDEHSLVSAYTCVLRGLLWGWTTGWQFTGGRAGTQGPGRKLLFHELLMGWEDPQCGERELSFPKVASEHF